MAYTVKSVERSRQWSSQQGGPMVSYYVTLQDSQGQQTSNVELAQKAATPEPQPGLVLDGNIDQGQYGPKFKKAFAGAGGGARPMSPEQQRAIVRQHAQKVLPDWLDMMFNLGIVERPKDKKAFLELSSGVMDWLTKDVDKFKAAS